MKSNIRCIFGFDPKYKNTSINKLFTYNELVKIRCNKIPYWDKEVEEFAKKHNFKTRIEAFKHMPKKDQNRIYNKWKDELQKRCSYYMSHRIEEDSKIRKELLRNNKIVEYDKTPKFYTIFPYFAREMYSKTWSNSIRFYADSELIDNSVFMVIYIDGNKIKLRTFGVSFTGLKRAIKFWNQLSPSNKICNENGYCSRIQGATFDIVDFKHSIYKNNF